MPAVRNLCISLFCIIILVLIAGTGTESNNDGIITVNSFDDVPVEHYGDDPCAPFSPKMPDFRAPGRRISEVKCFEYVWRSKLGMNEFDRYLHCQFTKYNVHHIIGGYVANLGENSHMGALGWESISGPWVFKCGASLISNKFALTAAHCSRIARGDPTIVDTTPKIVRLGARTIRNQDHNNKPATDAIIKRIVVHPRYRSPRRYYDIAVIELQEEVEFERLVHPACLHASFDLPKWATIAGWGVINLATLETSPTLQWAHVNIVNSTDCDFLHRQKRNRLWKGLDTHQICAGHMAGGVDSCQGDSGGPLQVVIPDARFAHPNRWTVHRIIGITSFGYGCARVNSPGIYTRVASFVGWIEQIVWPETNNTSSRTSSEQ